MNNISYEQAFIHKYFIKLSIIRLILSKLEVQVNFQLLDYLITEFIFEDIKFDVEIPEYLFTNAALKK